MQRRSSGAGGKSMELRDKPGFRSGPLAVGPWASHITSLSPTGKHCPLTGISRITGVKGPWHTGRAH